MDAKSCPQGMGNVFKVECPSRQILEALAEKWTLLVIDRLAGQPMRTAQLRRAIEGISEKMLIQTLRKLERNGFVTRHAFAEVPPRVEYRLTPLGYSLAEMVRSLDRWVEVNYSTVKEAQDNYDSLKTA